MRRLSSLAFTWLIATALVLPVAAQRPVPPPEEPIAPKPTAVEIRKQTFKELKNEAERLHKTAEELRKALDRPGPLPTVLIAEKASEIEKHAKKIQSKLKGF